MARHRDPTDWEQEMGTRLKRLREAAGLSQSGLAQAAGISLRAVQHYEYGTRTFNAEVVVLLAKALGCSSDELLGLKPLPRQARGKK